MKKIFTGMLVLALFAIGAAHVYGQTNISVPQAREIALAMTGGGTISSLELASGANGPVYQIVVINNAMRYEVSINAQTGEVTRISAAQTGTPPLAAAPQAAPQIAPQATPQAGGIFIGNVVPRPARRPGGPVNPPISAQRAVELARDHLLSLNITDARFDYIYMDIERGRWVWSVEFDGRGGRDFEFYVDVQTGAFLKAPGMAGGRGR